MATCMDISKVDPQHRETCKGSAMLTGSTHIVPKAWGQDCIDLQNIQSKFGCSVFSAEICYYVARHHFACGVEETKAPKQAGDCWYWLKAIPAQALPAGPSSWCPWRHGQSTCPSPHNTSLSETTISKQNRFDLLCCLLVVCTNRQLCFVPVEVWLLRYKPICSVCRRHWIALEKPVWRCQLPEGCTLQSMSHHCQGVSFLNGLQTLQTCILNLGSLCKGTILTPVARA